ncbi:hypothetical protein EV702DRAFT_1048050 [Suillus placidus]|uniref:DUF6535 domain-containing protein n=1 Tax=Suillus placidus TaxID=48579 RepID=A0A9P6ZPS0_9AGAM|nr:hypothetical protein EV702DRAFT_1048050 [Suillus placidus]
MATTLKQDPLRNDYVHVQKDIPAGLSTPQPAHAFQGPPQNNKFRASYNQVVKEHDGEFLERNNSDMDIVLISSGLFSAVNTAFIIAMQPNPTTCGNSFRTHPPTPPSHLSLPQQQTRQIPIGFRAWHTMHCHSTFWLLSGLSSANSGSAITNQTIMESTDNKKLDGLEAWHFHAVLQSFLMLLQISFFLFGIALPAFVWSQQGGIAIAVMVSTAFSLFFYSFIVVASLKSSRCPFQTPAPALVRILWRRLKDWGWKGKEEMYSSYDPGELEESQETLSVA